MATVTVNGSKVEIGDGARLNVIQAAKLAGVEVPHYCWHPSLSVVASCRMCLVEVGDTKPDGSVAMQPKVVPGCQTPVKDGTVIVTNSEKAKAAQAGTLEYILLDHPLDCPICDQAGECYLQDYSYKFGKAESRLNEPKTHHLDKHHIGDQIVLFTDRCVMCSRCVRFTREISGTGELQIINRGNHAEIDIFPGQPCNNKLAGNVVDICPVGALCSKDFLYKQRVWWLQSQQSVCQGCSTGCTISVDHNDNKIFRIKPISNPQSQGDFICDEGRFGFKYVHDERRLKSPMIHHNKTNTTSLEWEAVLPSVRKELASYAPAVVGVLSPMMLNEEAYLAAQFLKSLSKMVRLVLGPVPVVGTDDHFPKDSTGKSFGKPKFTIRAEKAPNRVGVSAIIEHFEGKVASWESALADFANGHLAAGFLIGGYPNVWNTAEQAATLQKAAFVAVLDLFPTPISEVASAVLAGGSFAEREGSVINYAGLAQKMGPAIKPPGDAWSDGRILHRLAGRTGLYHASSIRKELAQEIPYFAALGDGNLGPQGVLLGSAAAPALAK